MRITMNFLAVSLVLGSFSLVSDGQAVPIEPTAPSFSWLFDEGTGTTATAQFGTHDGTLIGAATYDNSDTPFSYEGNYAISLDGSSGFVEVADAIDLRPGTSAWTTAAWFKAPDANQQGSIFTKRMNGGTYNQWASYIGGTTNAIASGQKVQTVLIEGGSSRWWYHTDDDIVDGDWHHIAVVRPGSGDALVYIDGSLAATTLIQDHNTEPQDIDNTSPWQFGNSNGSNYFLDGLMDEVAMWDSALSADNVAWLASNSLVPPVPEPSSLLLLGFGVLGVLRHARRRRRSA